MTGSYFGTDPTPPSDVMAQGCKYSFLGAAPYNAPRYYGNIAAGYLITNALDIEKWLLAQLGLSEVVPQPLKQAVIGLADQQAVFVMCNINGLAPYQISTDIYQMLKGNSVKRGFLIGLQD